MKIKRLPKYFIFSLITILLMIAMAFMMPSPKRVVFFGDSITQMGAERGGYIDLMRDMLKAKNQEGEFELTGAGIGGNKIYDLYLRLDDDVLTKQPDIVFIFIGVNDVWHKTWGTGTDADKFEQFYTAVIHKIKASGAEVILCTPAVIGERTDFSNSLDGDLNKYSGIVRRLAEEEKCTLLDLRAKFLKYNLNHNPRNLEKGILTTDGVHLNPTGNKLVADAMIEVLLGH
ncbi:MAG: SGNH/GDSL hydrolase family protein [Lentimicrobium sp.]|jgi:lysophospholipase L1-like esterase|nr:SGNH/GDSL hydrolase family protein [Lentimicrobium sp.]HAH59288.1 G-D-S-L family lipolytic protein [Bacteroidales bacterium]